MNATNQTSVDWTSLSLTQNAWHSLWENRKTVLYISFFGLLLPQIVLNLAAAQGGLTLLTQAAEITANLAANRSGILADLGVGLESMFGRSLGIAIILWPISIFACLSLVHLSLKRTATVAERFRELPRAMLFSLILGSSIFMTQSLFLIQFAIKVLGSVGLVLIVSESIGAFRAYGWSLVTKYLKDTTQTGLGLFFNLATPHAILSILYDLMNTTSNYWAENSIHLGSAWTSPGFFTMVLRATFFSFYIPFALFLAATVYQKARKRLTIIT
jgi:hypothetical protein